MSTSRNHTIYQHGKALINAGVGLFWGLVKGMPLRFVELIGQIFPESSAGCMIRGMLYRPFLGRCGKNFQVGLAVKLEHCRNISVGDHVYIGHGSWISGIGAGIILDDQVMLGPLVTMVSGNHAFVSGSARFSSGPQEPTAVIRVGYGTWIAAHCVVTAGVTIGRSCLVAAGAVITRDVPNFAIVGGVPAKIIGDTRRHSHGATD